MFGNKKRIFPRILAVLVCLCLCTAIAPQTANAASISVSASSTTVEVGQTVTVTATVSGSNLGGAQVNFSGAVSASRSGDGGTAPGSSSISVSTSFTPSEPGTYTVTATAGKIGVYVQNEDGSYRRESDSAGSASVTITVKGTATPTPTATATPTSTPTKTPTPTPTKTPTPSPSKTPTASPSQTTTATPSQSQTPTPSPSPSQVTFVELTDQNGTKHRVQVALPQGLSTPAGMTNTTVTAEQQQIAACKTEDGALCMVCVTDNNDANPRWMVLDTAKMTLSSAASFQQKADYTIYPIDSALAAPEGFAAVELDLENGAVAAWQDLSREGFYMVYANNAGGMFGYYIFDAQEGTLQRFVQSGDVILPTPTPTPSPSPTPSPVAEESSDDSALKTWRIIGIIAICGFILALGALSVTVFLQYHPGKLLKDQMQEMMQEQFEENAFNDSFEDDYSYTDNE